MVRDDAGDADGARRLGERVRARDEVLDGRGVEDCAREATRGGATAREERRGRGRDVGREEEGRGKREEERSQRGSERAAEVAPLAADGSDELRREG